jgi:hypothetical protein
LRTPFRNNFFLSSSSCRQSEKTCDGNERKIGHLFDVSTLLLFDNPTEHFLRFCFQAPSIAPAVDLNFSFLAYPYLTAVMQKKKADPFKLFIHQEGSTLPHLI